MTNFNLSTAAKLTTTDEMVVLSDVPRFHARTQPQAIAFVSEGRSTSYATLDNYSSQVANGLLSLDLSARSKVGWLDINSDHFFETLFGCAKANLVICPINWRLAANELIYIINDADIEVLCVGERFIEIIASIQDQLPQVRHIITVSGRQENWLDYRQWRDQQSSVDPDLNAQISDPAILMYTSGTTGNPKGVVLPTGALLATIGDDSEQMSWDDWHNQDVSLLMMPCFHIAGVRWGMMGLIPGASNVILPEFNPEAVIESIERHRVNKVMLVPAAIQLVLQTPSAKDCDFSSLKLVWYGASPMPLALLKDAMALFQCQFLQTYGLTETCGQTTYLPPEDHNNNGNQRMTSAGKPLPNVKIRIEDLGGNVLNMGEAGEICIHSPTNMTEYWKQPSATRDALRQGWVHTGDVGYLDDDGYLFICDRLKDMVLSGGENIYSSEVENALFTHPAISEVAVIGVPDDRWGEAVKAIVVVKEDSEVSEDDIIAYSKQQIASYKTPKSVDFIEALPKNSTGKVLKKELRKKYWQDQACQVN